MDRVFEDKNGNVSPVPFSLEHAKRINFARYRSGEICTECKHTDVKYTKSGACVQCSLLAAIDLHAFAIGAMSFCDFETESSTLFSGLSVGNREVPFEYRDTILAARELLGFLEGRVKAPLSGTAAREAGLDLWVRETPCSRSGHLGVRTLTGECYFCKLEREAPSPRKAALEAGSTWYVPHVPCKRCGQLAERNVHNGSCRNCNPPSKVVTPDMQLMGSSPDLITSRDDAIAYGFKVYRTGEPCRRGHRGFRYVSTKNCIDCLK